MKSTIGLLAGALLSCAAGAHAQDVGRVLLATGSATAVRGGQTIPLTLGATVREQDVLRTGAGAALQVRFIDESVTSLRENSELRIDQFRFSGREDGSERAFFRLVKGGLRTITGLIGRNNHRNYGLSSNVSTIGIRGTDFATTLCQQDCRNPDGSLAPDGQYGRVLGQSHGTNRIEVSGAAGQQRTLGLNDNFYQADAKSPILLQLVPAPFVGSQSPATRTAKPAQGTGTEQTAAGGTTQDSRGTTPLPAIPTVLSFAAPGPGDTGAPPPTADSAAILAALVPSTGSAFYRLTGPFNLPVSCSSPPCPPLVSGDITVSIDYAARVAYVRVNAADNEYGIVNISTPPAALGIPLTVSGSQVTFSGTFNRADFPTNNGAFRCFDCGSIPMEVDYFDSLTFSGTISGTTATLTVTAKEPTGDTGTATAALTEQTPPNGLAAAMVIPRQGGGANPISAAFWDVEADGAGRALRIDQGGTVGARRASVGSAVNTTVGSAPDAGNLVWGTWSGGGANITDINYASFVATGTQQWITGNATTSLPVSLGSSVSYSLIGGVVNNGTGVINSASLTANFLARTMTLSINSTNPGAGNTFQMDGSSGIVSTNARFQANFSSVSCSGPCSTGTPSGGFAGFFAGPNAEGAGVAFSAGYGTGGGVNGVAGMKR